MKTDHSLTVMEGSSCDIRVFLRVPKYNLCLEQGLSMETSCLE